MHSRYLLYLLFFVLPPGCTPIEQGVITIQLLDNVRAGGLVYQAYNIPESAIAHIEKDNKQPLNLQFLVGSLIQRSCMDEADDELRSCESDTVPIDWFTLSTTTLCLTAESIAGRGDVKTNVCLIFPHAMPFPSDLAEEPKVVELALVTGKKWVERHYTYIEVLEVKLH